MPHNNTGLDFFVDLNPQNDIYDSLPPALKDAIEAMSTRINEDLLAMAVEAKIRTTRVEEDAGHE